VIVSRVGAALAAVHVTALAVLAAFAMSGRMKLNAKKLLPFLGLSVGSVAMVLVGSSLYFNYVASSEYEGYRLFVEMEMAAEPVASKAYDLGEASSDGRPALERFEGGAALRFCYGPDALPFAFRNANGNLVGFNVEMAHLLARDLGVPLEFVRVESDEAPGALQGGLCDMAMAIIPMTPEMSRRVAFTIPYMSETAAFLVRDHRREEFSTRDALMSHGALRIGIPDVPYYERLAGTYLPQAEWVKMDSPRPFLRGDVDDLDAYIYTAEAGSAWTLIYPEYSVAVPKPDTLSIPNAASVRIDDEEWHAYLNLWIRLKLEGGEIGELHDRWILGKEAKRGKPRWCVCRDVLGWMD